MAKWGLIACVLAAIVYANTLFGSFVYDDRRAVLSNPDTNSKNSLVQIFWDDFWGVDLRSDSSHGSYRPLTVLTYRWNHWISGYSPTGYHFVNIVLHVIATGLVNKLGKLLLSEDAAGFSAILFAVHPIHTEAVASIVGRADVLSCVYFLLSIINFIKYKEIEEPWEQPAMKSRSPPRRNRFCEKRSRRSPEKSPIKSHSFESSGKLFKKYGRFGFTVLFATLATFSKEPGISALPVCLVFEILMQIRIKIIKPDAKLRWMNTFVLLISTCLLVTIRLLLANFNVPTFSSSDNPIIKSNLLTRTLTIAYLPVFNILLTVFPYFLSFDWGMDSIPRITSVFDLRNFMSITFYIFVQFIVVKNFIQFIYSKTRHAPNCFKKDSCLCAHFTNQKSLTPPAILLFLSALSVIPFLPAANVFFYVGFMVAERVLFMPTVGLCMLVGYCYDKNWIRHNQRFYRIFFLIILLFSIRSVMRNDDWKTDEKLYRSNIYINPPKAYGNLGSILSSEGRYGEAEVALRKALYYRYNMAEVHYNLGLLLEQNADRYEESVMRYNAAIKYRPSMMSAYLRLAYLLHRHKRIDDAIEILSKGLKVDISQTKDIKVNEIARTESYVELATIHIEENNLIEGLNTYVEAVAKAPHYYKPQALFVYIGETLMKMKNYEDAEIWYQFITGDKPIVPKVIMKLKSFVNCSKTVRRKWVKAMEMFTFRDPYLYLQYSQLLINDNKLREALLILERAITMKAQDHFLLLQAGRIGRVAGFYKEAENYLKKLINLHPVSSSYKEYAILLKARGKMAEAMAAYRRYQELQIEEERKKKCDKDKKCDTSDIRN